MTHKDIQNRNTLLTLAFNIEKEAKALKLLTMGRTPTSDLLTPISPHAVRLIPNILFPSAFMFCDFSKKKKEITELVSTMRSQLDKIENLCSDSMTSLKNQ